MRSLHQYGIYHNNIKRALFDNFLLQPGHEHFLQDYLIYCSGLDQKRIQGIVKAFEFTLHGGYTYGRLFQIHHGWKDFFKENAWHCGIARQDDIRIGVDSIMVDKVMRLYTTGDLDNAIIQATTPNIN